MARYCWRHKAAGAEAVLICIAVETFADQRYQIEDMSLESLVSTYLSDLDIVLTEGYKKAQMAQVEVFLESVERRAKTI